VNTRRVRANGGRRFFRLGFAVLALLLIAPAVSHFGVGAQVPQEPPPEAPASTDWRTLVGGPGPDWAPVVDQAGALYVPAGDFARLLDATKFWRSDLRKLVLRARSHRIQLTVDNPFVVVDDRTLRLEHPVRSRNGEVAVPVALVDSLAADTAFARLTYDPGRGVVLRVPEAGIVGTPRVSVEDGRTRITFPVDRPEEFVVASRSRAHFRLRMSGTFAGRLPSSFPEGSLVRSLKPIAAASGSAFVVRLAEETGGYRVVPDVAARRVTVFFDRDGQSLERFAPEGTRGPRDLRVIVIDPGHGGDDPGVVSQNVVEKDLTLRLARLLRAELERRLAVRVVLTREDDRAVPPGQRAERANRARADLVLALHFDGVPGSHVRGATAYCPPAEWASSPRDDRSGAIPLIPWRDVALRHAVRSRELAESVLSAIELRAQGPTRLREILPQALLGVNAPGVLLECATLTHSDDRTRVSSVEGLDDLAATIADGIETYQLNP
jgi:N-acetylmuramoyl-L-alanine amidase